MCLASKCKVHLKKVFWSDMNDADMFNISRKSDRLKILLPSDMRYIENVDNATKQFLEENRLSSEVFAVCLGMREGLTNAIKHGNGFDRNKTVTYSLVLEKNRMIMAIEDQGDGFDWEKIQKRILPIDSDHGRGIAIIQKYFDEYQYNDKGNRLVLIRNLPQT